MTQNQTLATAAQTESISVDFRANFMVVGTARGGTTSLASYLARHPDVCLSLVKEAHFFDREPDAGESWDADYDDYNQYFAHYAGEKAIGEATPPYMHAPFVARRLYDYNPRLKLIFLLRHPVDRAYSHYHFGDPARRPGSFAEAVRIEEELFGFSALPSDAPWTMERAYHSLIDRGFYLKQIKNMLRYFPREQMLFVRSEELGRRHRDTIARIYEFLGVDPETIPEPERLNSRVYAPMDPAVRARLLAVYAQEVEQLERFLDWELSEWRT